VIRKKAKKADEEKAKNKEPKGSNVYKKKVIKLGNI
jgi:hypothetical protein